MHTTPLEQLVDECVRRHGAHVIDIVIKGRQRRPAVEVFVDAESGVTTELCSAISRDIHAAVRARRLPDDIAQLTVSSPGSDRPLRYPWQYRKHVGRDLVLRHTAGGAEEECAGRLAEVDDEGLVLNTGKQGEQRRFPFTTIVRAVVKTPW
jgi:ribosome maturation factor RimP